MQNDLNANFPSTEIEILGINEVGQESQNEAATDDLDLPWLQDVDADQNGNSDVWRDQWDVEWRDVVILNEQNEAAGLYNLTPNDLGQQDKYDELRQMIVDVATAQRTAANEWQNRVEPLDVTSDMFVSPIDALTLINKINAEGSYELAPPAGDVEAYYDPSGDGFISPRDALLVINHLNDVAGLAAGQAANAEAAEGEPLTDAADLRMTADEPIDAGPEELSEPNHAKLPSLREYADGTGLAPIIVDHSQQAFESELDATVNGDPDADVDDWDTLLAARL